MDDEAIRATPCSLDLVPRPYTNIRVMKRKVAAMPYQ
jgi:hypothetical protein